MARTSLLRLNITSVTEDGRMTLEPDNGQTSDDALTTCYTEYQNRRYVLFQVFTSPNGVSDPVHHGGFFVQINDLKKGTNGDAHFLSGETLVLGSVPDRIRAILNGNIGFVELEPADRVLAENGK